MYVVVAVDGLQAMLCLQLLEGIKAEIAAIKADPDLCEEEKQERAKNKMQALYAASGCAKVKGALEQVERALQEGHHPALPYPMALLSTAVQVILMTLPLLCRGLDSSAMSSATRSPHDHATASPIVMMMSIRMFASRY